MTYSLSDRDADVVLNALALATVVADGEMTPDDDHDARTHRAEYTRVLNRMRDAAAAADEVAAMLLDRLARMADTYETLARSHRDLRAEVTEGTPAQMEWHRGYYTGKASAYDKAADDLRTFVAIAREVV